MKCRDCNVIGCQYKSTNSEEECHWVFKKKKVPDKIYVPQHDIEAGNIQELDELIVAGSTEYIRKAAIQEWATQKWNEYTTRYHDGKCTSGEDWGQMVAFRTMIDKLNSL